METLKVQKIRTLLLAHNLMSFVSIMIHPLCSITLNLNEVLQSNKTLQYLSFNVTFFGSTKHLHAFIYKNKKET